MNRFFIMALIVAATAGQLRADGKMFWPEEVPPEIPYQRALIFFGDNTETLVLQSKYEIREAHGESPLGWVVPVPAVPEVASMPASEASDLFRLLSMITRPRVTYIGSLVIRLIIITIAGLSALTLLLCLLSLARPFPPSFVKRRVKLCIAATVWIVVVGPFLAVSPGISAGTSSGVDVIAEHRVGIYDVRIVRSDDAEELISWLQVNKFMFTQKDTAAFDSYISKEWCFVVAAIHPAKDRRGDTIASEGLVAPLILRFPSAQPVYPLALTGTGGFETEILIYLASQMKMSCDDQLTLRFAEPHPLRYRPLNTEPKEFLDLTGESFTYLCKFKGRLTSAEMKRDIVFSPATDNAPYREHIKEW